MLQRTFLALFNLIIFFSFFGQDTIHLINPSFEQSPLRNSPITGWDDCGIYDFPEETPPDIFPKSLHSKMGYPQDGYTFLGLAVRENGSFEAISQELEHPLYYGDTYELSLHLRVPEEYLSGVRGDKRIVNFNNPVVLRVWGGVDYCSGGEYLGETVPVTNLEWEEYVFTIKPEDGSWYYLTLEAFFKDENTYFGSVFVDNCSLVRINEEKSKAQFINLNFDWLLGNWIMTNSPEGTKTYERWEKSSEDEYIGFGFTLQERDTVFQEQIRLYNSDDNWIFEVTGVNEDPTPFQIIEYTENSFIVENKENEFPKTIEYRRSREELHAKIADDNNELHFIFKKEASE